MAFASATGLGLALTSGVQRGATCARRRHRPVRTNPRAQQEREVAPDNDELQRALRGRVKELYGGAENVQISVAGDSPEFTVLNTPKETDPEYGQAVFTVQSIAVLSLVAGLLFTFMYWSGAVHGSPDSATEDGTDVAKPLHPKYDPYELLEAASRYDEEL